MVTQVNVSGKTQILQYIWKTSEKSQCFMRKEKMGKYSLRQKPKISASCLVLVFTPLANGMAMGLCWEVLIL